MHPVRDLLAECVLCGDRPLRLRACERERCRTHDIHPGQEYIKPLAEALLDGATTVSEAVKTVVGYKIFHVRKDGTIGPLFINRKQVVPQGEWLPAEDPGPQRGYQHRPGWHAAPKPEAPHLMTKSGKLATDRRWYKVHLRDAEKIKRPKAQGGHWYLAKQMKVVGPVD